MEIHILFTCDAHKSDASRRLRGVFTNLEDLEKAKKVLIKNEVIEKPVFEDNEFFDVVVIEENEFESDGGYY